MLIYYVLSVKKYMHENVIVHNFYLIKKNKFSTMLESEKVNPAKSKRVNSARSESEPDMAMTMSESDSLGLIQREWTWRGYDEESESDLPMIGQEEWTWRGIDLCEG